SLTYYEPFTTPPNILLASAIEKNNLHQEYLSYNDSLLMAYITHLMPENTTWLLECEKYPLLKKHMAVYHRKETLPVDVRNKIIQDLPILDIQFSVIDLRLLNAINLITNLKDDEPCKEIYTITCRLLDDEPGLKPAQLVHKLHSSIKSDFYKVAKISFFCNIILLAYIVKKKFSDIEKIIDLNKEPDIKQSLTSCISILSTIHDFAITGQYQDGIKFLESYSIGHDSCKRVYDNLCDKIQGNMFNESNLDQMNNAICEILSLNHCHDTNGVQFYLDIIVLACVANKQYKLAELVVDKFVLSEFEKQFYLQSLEQYIVATFKQERNEIYGKEFFGTLFKSSSKAVVVENKTTHNHSLAELKKRCESSSSASSEAAQKLMLMPR
ncbi:MAG: hypothetical protein ACK4PR_13915, partial [Gammaproteobacteria bacterium]